jgi:serine/threonine-protein kinase HipA
MIDPAVVTVSLHGKVVGRLAITPAGRCAFQYDTAYLQAGHSISPLDLPLAHGVTVAKPDPFAGGFGVFDDSLPDGWGRLVQDRVLRQRGVDPFSLNTLARLALVGRQGRGALEYEPSQALAEELATEVDLVGLARAAADLLRTDQVGVEELAMLARLGGTSGGARPKAFLADANGQWLVKFPAQVDPPEVGRIEFAHSVLAGRCGVLMAETRLFEGRFFGASRFDRTDQGKVHVVSAAGLVNADYRVPSLDYTSLLALTRRLTRDMAEVEQMYRRMVFNVAIGNRDDHAKNFAFMMDPAGRWRLAPAYDLLPSPGFNGFHTTTVNGAGRPTDDDLVAVGVRAGLRRRDAVEVVRQIRFIVNSGVD